MSSSFCLCLFCILGYVHLSLSEADDSITVTTKINAPTTEDSATKGNEAINQSPKSSTTAPQSRTTSVKKDTTVSSVPLVSYSSQQTLGPTTVVPVTVAVSTVSARDSPGSTQVTAPTPVSGAPELTNPARSSTLPSSSMSTLGASGFPSDSMSTVAGGVITMHTNKTLTSPEASTRKDASPLPSTSVGQTLDTTSSLAKPVSSSPGENTLTPSLVTNTTVTQLQNTTAVRGSATSLNPTEINPMPTTPAVSSSTITTQKSGFPEIGPAASVTSLLFTSSPIQVICVLHNLSDTSVIILKQIDPRPCNLSLHPIEKGLPDMLCQHVKSAFTPSRDRCTVRLGYSEDPANKLALLGVSVETYSMIDEMYDMLEVKRDKLREFGFSSVMYASNKVPSGNEDWLSMPLIITIVCMAVSLLLIAVVYGCWHQRHTSKKDQHRLTEELQTMENGYHDNPTLDVMETSPEMQEKKTMGLNGEIGDSWIVPMDHLSKEDLDEEEDTHL